MFVSFVFESMANHVFRATATSLLPKDNIKYAN